MGSVTRMDPRRERPETADDIGGVAPRPPCPEMSGPVPLPRRTIEARDRAAIIVDVGTGELGHSLTLPGTPEQTAVLRRYMAALALLPAPKSDVLQGLVSELFTNAVRHSRSGLPGGEVVATLHRLRGRVQVRVTDQGPYGDVPGTPHVREQDLEREGGFGMRLVAMQADRWGTLSEGGRTTVWFELDRG
ncbi:ATP-binding protein [Nocardiopsis lambiniae]|uniref:ATP-binding protein n=1 Tax=Nocardiopsis lambiniae TaxID=3075539 RepID=A0ABU2MGT7_9ACTN|nr:ATP-binding protein [Nocardiopsis sp. DSM 44743]MDT0331920.1 ATP-binding protein [Nocardiopsis sp. DSM 44743]